MALSHSPRRRAEQARLATADRQEVQHELDSDVNVPGLEAEDRPVIVDCRLTGSWDRGHPCARHLPLLALQARLTWEYPHYRFFPLVPIGAGWLAVRAGRRLGPLEPGPVSRLALQDLPESLGRDRRNHRNETLGLGLRQGSSRTDAKPPGLVLEAKNRRRLRVASGGRRDIRW